MAGGAAGEEAAPTDSSAQPARYGAADYWDNRYQNDVAQQRAFEWYASFKVLRDIMRAYVPCSADVLHVGCGNSPWVSEMVVDGHTGRIVNIDISSVIIDYMRQKHAELPSGVSWCVADVTDLRAAHDDGSFDAVIDKGTMDALMCGGDSVGNTAAMACEMFRVLRPGGVFVMITYGEPASRLPVLQAAPLAWDVSMHLVSKQLGARLESAPPARVGPLDVSGDARWDAALKRLPLDDYHYIYVCRKRGA